MESTELQTNSRNLVIDIMKGICIILVVLGHTYNSFTHDFIYLFHVSIFYILAGYCFNIKYTESFSGIITIIKKRILTLWLPYFAYNFIFLLLQNVFLKIGLLTSNELYFTYKPMLSDGFVTKLTIRDSLVIFIKSIFFMGSRPFCGALWFLGGLFYTTIFYTCLGFILRKIKMFSYVRIFISIVFLIIGFLLVHYGYTKKGLIKYLALILITDFPFSLGAFLKSFNLCSITISTKKKIILFASSFLILLILVQFGTISIGSLKIVNPIFYILAIFFGFVFIFCIALMFIINKKLSQLFGYIGQHTMVVLALHTLSFKLVTFIQYTIYKGDIIVLSLFPVWHSELLWSIIYTITGIIIPLLIGLLLGRNKVLRTLFKL